MNAISITKLLEERKHDYNKKQSFEKAKIEPLFLDSCGEMLSFMCYGENGKSLSLFSIVSTNDSFPIRFISSQHHYTFEENDREKLQEVMNDVCKKRIKLIEEYQK